MDHLQVPRIFNAKRRIIRDQRAAARQRKDNAAKFVWEEIAQDMIERMLFVRCIPRRSLVLGPCPSALADHLAQDKAYVERPDLFDLEAPYPTTDLDIIAAIGQFDSVNDLPGALIHIRNALKPGGLAIASFIGGSSLPRLRAAMLAADGDRPAARIHPMVDPRAAPALLQRAGWRDPVVDTHRLRVRYSSLDQLVSDLRDQGLTSALADMAPPIGKAALARARQAFLEQADADGKVTEIFEIVTLTGRRSLAGT